MNLYQDCSKGQKWPCSTGHLFYIDSYRGIFLCEARSRGPLIFCMSLYQSHILCFCFSKLIKIKFHIKLLKVFSNCAGCCTHVSFFKNVTKKKKEKKKPSQVSYRTLGPQFFCFFVCFFFVVLVFFFCFFLFFFFVFVFCFCFVFVLCLFFYPASYKG